MVQVTYGGEYIQIPADEFPILARAMQSVITDLRDMSRQYPRSKNMNEASAAKIQKAHGQVVAKMKELAKQYKAGDKSVVGQLKDLTAKKKELEKHLEKAVAGIGKGQQLAEVTEDEVQDAIYELRNLIDEIDQKADEAREIVRAVFPNELSRLDAYGAFNAMNSANRYDVTLGGFVDRLEEEGFEIEDGEVFTLEGEYKSDAQRKAIYAAKAEKNESFKVGDKVTYLGHPGEITKVNKEMTGAITYNVAYNKGTGRTKATNIYNKGGEIKAVKEAELSKDEKKKLKDMSKSLKKSTKGHAAQAKYLDKLVKEQKATCCGRCGRVHVKGTKCKSPYLKGKDHCRYN